jgi:hypothetical protein
MYYKYALEARDATGAIVAQDKSPSTNPIAAALGFDLMKEKKYA